MPVPFGGGVPVMQGQRRSYGERRRTDADVFPCAGRKGMVRMLSFHRRQYHEKGGAPSGMFPAALSSGGWPSIRKNAPPRRRLKRRRRENVENRSAREGNKRTEFREGRILLEPFRAREEQAVDAGHARLDKLTVPRGKSSPRRLTAGMASTPKAWKPHPRRRTGEPLRTRGTKSPYGKTTPRRRETQRRGKTSLRAALPSIRRTTPPRNPAHGERREEGFDKDESL